ncbi:HFL064Cp [Eremothecium sinecaudum]|uniref:HFL064Cp n=1 Tax=Eremothecium sinecaudum TaxID=45286 RepID=A0A0X8HUP2_9SACH|nr:HFL064Cp [Eremothecium sinecaudum]AMD21792.1 HFL064Cp [Eremothecium sinecaudum]
MMLRSIERFTFSRFVRPKPFQRTRTAKLSTYYRPINNNLPIKKSNKLLITASGLSAIALGLWYFYWPHHKFPSPVAKLLRKALWEESDRKGNDYHSALKYYIDALEKCDELQMEPISDEYTGIQIKIAEMYEKMNMHQEAYTIYLEMLHRYYEALMTEGKITKAMRPHFIQKDLRALIKALEMNQNVAQGKKLLLMHLLLAQEEILLRSPELKKFFARRKEEAATVKDKEQLQQMRYKNFKSHVNGENIKLDENGNMILDLQKDSSAWHPFKEEFFTARDLYTVYCLSTNDLPSALSSKLTTVEWMVMADMPPGQILLSQANLGSLLYLEAERTEAILYKMEEEFKGKEKSNKDIQLLRTLHSKRSALMDMATTSYQSIITFAKKNKKLRFHAKEMMDSSASQAVALSTYGLGVINLHQGQLSVSEKLLLDAIALAKDTDFHDLTKEANQELNKLKRAKEAKAKESNRKGVTDNI